MRSDQELAVAPPRAPGGVLGTIGSLVGRGLEKQAVRLAILRGERDEGRLTNQVFSSRHRERAGRGIGRNEPQLAKEWREIRDTIVRPVLVETARGADTRIFFGLDTYSGGLGRSTDWARAKSDGRITFAIIKASQGVGADSAFRREWPRLRDAGLVRGAYLFLNLPSVKRPRRQDPVAQAKKFIATVGSLAESDLPPSLDVEFPRGRAKNVASARQCLVDISGAWKAFADRYGVAPIVYTSARVWHEDLDNLPAPDLAQSPLWLARYPFRKGPFVGDPRVFAGGRHEPPVPPPWGDGTNWWIHQYQGDASGLPGVHEVDMNRLNTTSAGAIGDRVRWVQRRLGMQPSGSFDAATERALRTFQQRKGLPVDGVVDPRTFAYLCWSNPGR